MLSLNVKTKLKPGEVTKKAVEYFGPGGYGLKVVEQGDAGVYFEGGGGGVQISACAGEKETSVDLVTREWEYQVKEFALKIK